MDSDVAYTISSLTLGERAALMEFLALACDDDPEEEGVRADLPAAPPATRPGPRD